MSVSLSCPVVLCKATAAVCGCYEKKKKNEIKVAAVVCIVTFFPTAPVTPD